MKTIVTGLLALMISGLVFADGKSNGGDEFRKAAEKYQMKSNSANLNGDSKTAQAYRRMAEIKIEAASLADSGRWSEIDWSEYHVLNAQVLGHKSTNKSAK
jgi:hypothetical protein